MLYYPYIILYYVQKLNSLNDETFFANMVENQDQFNVLRKINKSKKLSQRKLASMLGFSLGKMNYCLKSLKHKGLIKISHFGKNKNKLNYIYILTPHGIATKTRLTINFMKKKMKEYDELRKELGKEKEL